MSIVVSVLCPSAGPRRLRIVRRPQVPEKCPPFARSMPITNALPHSPSEVAVAVSVRAPLGVSIATEADAAAEATRTTHAVAPPLRKKWLIA